MVTKKYLKTKPICKVRFEVLKEDANGFESINLVGDFNAWNEKSTPFKRLKNGNFVVTLDLDVDQQFQFRYLAEGHKWFNEVDAESYEQTHFHDAQNSLIST